MHQFDLAAMAKPRKGTFRLPEMSPSLVMERSYLTILRSIEHEAAAAIKDTIKPAYQRQLPIVKETITLDADEYAFAAFKQRLMDKVQDCIRKLDQLLKVEAARHTKAWSLSAKRALGVDISGLVNQDDVRKMLEIAALRNASLITNFTEDMIKKVQQATLEALPTGQSYTRLAAVLKKVLAISDSRALLIAQDQTNKLNSELTMIRHKQAGVDKYVWRTSEDERVRPLHRQLDGKVYKYGEPTGAEGGLPPGQPIRCRCVACGVVEWDDKGKV